MMYKRKKNIAGLMGSRANQPTKGISMAASVNPLERTMQRAAGKSNGRSQAGIKKRKTMLSGLF